MSNHTETRFLVRRSGEGRYRLELVAKERGTLLYGVTRATLAEAAGAAQTVRAAAAGQEALHVRTLDESAFLQMEDPAGRALFFSAYYQDRAAAEQAAPDMREAIMEAPEAVDTGRDGEHLDERPDVEGELRDAFRILDRDTLAERLAVLAEAFGRATVEQGLENLVAGGGKMGAKAASAAVLLDPPPLSVARAAAGSVDAAVRVTAAYHLPAYAGAPDAERLLVTLLGDGDEAVAYRALVSAGEMLSDDVRRVAGHMAAGHPSRYVREEAQRLLDR